MTFESAGPLLGTELSGDGQTPLASLLRENAALVREIAERDREIAALVREIAERDRALESAVQEAREWRGRFRRSQARNLRKRRRASPAKPEAAAVEGVKARNRRLARDLYGRSSERPPTASGGCRGRRPGTPSHGRPRFRPARREEDSVPDDRKCGDCGKAWVSNGCNETYVLEYRIAFGMFDALRPACACGQERRSRLRNGCSRIPDTECPSGRSSWRRVRAAPSAAFGLPRVAPSTGCRSRPARWRMRSDACCRWQLDEEISRLEAPVVNGDETGWTGVGRERRRQRPRLGRPVPRRDAHRRRRAARKPPANCSGASARPSRRLTWSATVTPPTGSWRATWTGASSFPGSMPDETSSTSRPATRTSRRSPGSGSATSCTGSTPNVWRTRDDATAQRRLARFAEAFFAAAKKARDALPESAAQRGPLDSLARHRDGLTVFVDNASVPMDNNAAERGLRGVGRKLSFGSHSVDGARLAGMSIFGTLEMNGVSPYPWLSACRLRPVRRPARPGRLAAVGRRRRAPPFLEDRSPPGTVNVGPRRYCGRDFSEDELGPRLDRKERPHPPGVVAGGLPASRLAQAQRRSQGHERVRRHAAHARPSCRRQGKRRPSAVRPCPAPQPTSLRSRLPNVSPTSNPSFPAGTRTKAASGTSSSLATSATRRCPARRYFVRTADGEALAVLGFGAAAWKIAPRDKCVGWDPETRRRNLPLVVNNARFLILPWIRIKNLASHVLTLVERRLPDDWESRYALRPVLLETFCETPRFRRNLLPGGQQGRRDPGPRQHPARTRSPGQGHLVEAPAAGLEADPQKIDRHLTSERLQIKCHPVTRRLLSRSWQLEQQPQPLMETGRLADDLGLWISVFPPGTSKWIEHGMFYHITHNRRGRLLTSFWVVVNLIDQVKSGLPLRFKLDENIYPTEQLVTDQQSLSLKRDNVHVGTDFRKNKHVARLRSPRVTERSGWCRPYLSAKKFAKTETSYRVAAAPAPGRRPSFLAGTHTPDVAVFAESSDMGANLNEMPLSVRNP